jgi:iron complex outermembrane recepter protein
MVKRTTFVALLAMASCVSYGQVKHKINVKDSLKMIMLQDVQVTSTRASKKTPMAFTNISKDEIKRINYGKDVPSLLEMTPSVVATSDAGTGIGYTAIHVRGTDPTRISITANGIPLNDAESNLVYWSNMPDFISSVENIQIQRGAGTSTNGAGAFGASINLQTSPLSPMQSTGLDFSAGSYGTHKETLKYSTGLLSGHWAFDARLSNIGSNGYIDRASAKMNSYFVQGGYYTEKSSIKFITFNGTEQTYHAWDYSSKSDWEEYGRSYNPCGKYTDSNGNIAYYDNQIDYYHQQHYQLFWNQIFTPALNLNVAIHYTHGNGYYEQYKEDQKLYKYLLTSTLGSKSDLIRQKNMDNDFYGTVLSLNYKKNSLDATIGGGWNRYDGDHIGNVLWVRSFSGSINPNQEYYNNNAKKNDANIYGKIYYNIFGGLSAYADLQYRHVTYKMTGMSADFDDYKKQIPFDVDKTFDFFNPKAGIFYDINKSNSAYFSFAVARKEPTRNDYEDYAKSQPKSERLLDWELGYKYKSRFFSAGFNLYYMKYKNQFVLTGSQDSNGEMIAMNVNDSYRSGIELMASANPFKGFTWNINATFSRNRVHNMNLHLIDQTTGALTDFNAGTTHLSYSPSCIFNNTLRYEYKGLSASLQSQYVSEQYMTNSDFRYYLNEDGSRVSTIIDAYFVSNLDLSYTFKVPTLKSITVGCTIYNIFNETYESNGACGLQFRSNGKGGAEAYQDDYSDSYATYSCQAPIHFLAHLSLNF